MHAKNGRAPDTLGKPPANSKMVMKKSVIDSLNVKSTFINNIVLHGRALVCNPLKDRFFTASRMASGRGERERGQTVVSWYLRRAGATRVLSAALRRRCCLVCLRWVVKGVNCWPREALLWPVMPAC